MKKKLSVLIAFLLAFCLLAKGAIAQVNPTVVGGKIYEADSETPVSGADVTVDCNDNTETTTSSEDGVYAVEFTGGVCNAGDTAFVTAAKDGASGSSSGVVHDYGLTVNVAIVNVSIPEFGLITGTLTLISSAGTFFLLKRH